MAKSDITLDIGSKFNGEGFKKLNQSIKGAAAQTRTASKNIGGVVQALGGVEGQVGKIFNNIGGLMGAFAQGGVFGLAVAGIGTAFKFVMDKIDEAKKKAEEAAKAMKESFQKMFDKLGDSISRIRESGNSRVEQGNYSADRMSKAITREQKAEIAKIRSEGIDRRSAMTDEDEKALDIAEEELKVQQLITKNLKEQSDLRVKNATNSYNAKLSSHEASVKKVNEAVEKYLAQVGEIDKKIDEQQKKIAAAEKHNASSERFQTVTTSVGTYTVDTSIDTKPMEEEIKKLTAQKNELYDIKQKTIDKIDLGKEEKEIQRALDAVVDANKDRELAAQEAALAEKKAAQKVKEANDKMRTGWANGKGAGENDPDKFVEEYNKEIDAKRRADIQKQLGDAQKEGAKQQKELNEKLAKAKNAVNDWVANLKNNRSLRFSDFNKAQNQAAKDNAVQLGVDADGNPIAIDKKQANQVKSNRQQLDRLLKMRNPDARTQKEIERRQAFDDMFNPEKLKERQKAAEQLEKQKAEAEKKMQQNIEALKKMLVDNNGVAI